MAKTGETHYITLIACLDLELGMASVFPLQSHAHPWVFRVSYEHRWTPALGWRDSYRLFIC